MINIGVIGIGANTEDYVKKLLLLSEYQVLGIYDQDIHFSLNTIKQYDNATDLIQMSDAVFFIKTGAAYFEIAKEAIRMGKHLLIDKSIATSLEQFEELINIADEANVKCMVCVDDRFNPAYQCLKSEVESPLFIETIRTIKNDAKESAHSVINELMFQDIDLILHLVKSDIKRISATGVKVINETSDIANARLEFSNGCVVNLTASRIALKNSHKMKVFQRNSYFQLDLNQQKINKVFFNATFKNIPLDSEQNSQNETQGLFTTKQMEVIGNETITSAFKHFSDCIVHHKIPQINPHESYMALDTVQKIIKKVNSFSEE